MKIYLRGICTQIFKKCKKAPIEIKCYIRDDKNIIFHFSLFLEFKANLAVIHQSLQFMQRENFLLFKFVCWYANFHLQNKLTPPPLYFFSKKYNCFESYRKLCWIVHKSTSFVVRNWIFRSVSDMLVSNWFRIALKKKKKTTKSL